MQHADPDRRAVVAGAGLLAFLAAPPAVAGSGDGELLHLGVLLDAVWSQQAALENAGGNIEELWQRAREIVDRIEPIPATTVAGLIVKTRACSWCHSGEPFEPDFFSTNGHPTTDRRLAASILRDLLTIGGKPIPQIT